MKERFKVTKSKTQNLTSRFNEELEMQESIRKSVANNQQVLKKKLQDSLEQVKRIKYPGLAASEESKNGKEKSFLASLKLANTKKQTYNDFPIKKRLKTKSQ